VARELVGDPLSLVPKYSGFSATLLRPMIGHHTVALDRAF